MVHINELPEIARNIIVKENIMNIQDLKVKGKSLIKSQVRNKFKGFKKNKLFYLMDGSGWIQKDYKYWYHYSYQPSATVYEYGGHYYFAIDGQSEFVEVKKANSVVRHTIISDFNGWIGDTIFKMENGEIWQQDEYEYEYNYSYRPNALIYSDGWNYRLEVEGYTIQVKRIK